MARFFVGQRVRIVNVLSPRNGCEARIVGRSYSMNMNFGWGYFWDCDVDGFGTHDADGVRFAYVDSNLEPILPDGHCAGDFTNVHDLLESLTKEVA